MNTYKKKAKNTAIHYLIDELMPESKRK